MGNAGRLAVIRRRGDRCGGVTRRRGGVGREVNGAAGPVAPWPLGDLDPRPPAPRWRFAIVSVESTGRVSLPVDARVVLGVGGGATVRALGRGDRLLLRGDGPGRRLAVDGRGRLTLPVWLRQAAGPSSSVLVGASGDAPVVLVAPTSLLDAWGDAAVGEQ